jgi:alpha-glucoside transport system substrate-binding protein
MPGAVGAGTFWKGMVDWINGTPQEEVLTSIEGGWPTE